MKRQADQDDVHDSGVDGRVPDAGPLEPDGESISSDVEDLSMYDDSQMYAMNEAKHHEQPADIYFLGCGPLGIFVAHALANVPRALPITFLFSSSTLMERFKSHGKSIKFISHGVEKSTRGFDAEYIRPVSTEVAATPLLEASPASVQQSNQHGFEASRDNFGGYYGDSMHGSLEQESEPFVTHSSSTTSLSLPNWPGAYHQPPTPIKFLIVTLRPQSIVNALQRIKSRLSSESAIFFLNHGMGLLEEINEQVFPAVDLRPSYLFGVYSHTLVQNRSFEVEQIEAGIISYGVPLDRQAPVARPPNAAALRLSRLMLRSPILAATNYRTNDFHQIQLDKLAISAIIQPLTAVLGSPTGHLLLSFYFRRLIRMLIAEASLVIKSLPELQGIPNVQTRYDTIRLERIVLTTAEFDARLKSRMVQDLAKNRLTEINYLNGYLIDRGEELGIHCVTHYFLQNLLLGKTYVMYKQSKDSSLPFADDGLDERG